MAARNVNGVALRHIVSGFHLAPKWPKHSQPLSLRVCVSGVFVGLGLSGVVPTLHFVISEGLIKATTMGQMGWLLLMATLYITGACLYAARIPERFFPGKCDIWVSDRQTPARTEGKTSGDALSSSHFVSLLSFYVSVSHLIYSFFLSVRLS